VAETDQEKTQEPTEKRLEDARKRGDVPMAQDMRHAVMFAAILLLLSVMGAAAAKSLSKIFIVVWGGADRIRFADEGAQSSLAGLMQDTVLAIAPILALLMASAVAVFVLQGRPVLAWSRLAIKWDKLSPVAGLKRIFGPQGLFEFAKSLLKAGLIIGLATAIVWPNRVAMSGLVGAGPVFLSQQLVLLVLNVLQPIVLAVVIVAAGDLFFQNRSYMKRMMMTLQEIKDEMKDSEGNPLIKSRQRAIAYARARRRMMAAVPTASVIITNPTHYAIALNYEHGVNGAPVVVAKGVDLVALKIREIATEAGVPIVESPPLARALYAGVEIDHPIPVEHYTAVAEIISFVMRLRRTPSLTQ